MRIQCIFNLAPELYEQHEFAVENIRAWLVTEKERKDNQDIAHQRRSNFNRDIYLSGLYLHQLSAELPALVSEQYRANEVSVKRLTQQVALFDDATGADKEQTATVSHKAVLEEEQWQKLDSMLRAHHQSVTAPLSEQIAALSITSMVEQMAKQLSELHSQQQEMVTELQHQVTALSDRSSEVETSKLSTEGSDHLAIEASLDKHKDDLLAAIETNQKKLITTFNGLKKQVSGLSNSLSNVAVTSAEEELEAQALTAQLQRASKVKSKGLW